MGHSSRSGPSLRFKAFSHNVKRSIQSRVNLELMCCLSQEHFHSGNYRRLPFPSQLQKHRVLGVVNRVEKYDARSRERSGGKRCVVQVRMHADRSAIDDHVGDNGLRVATR